MQQEPDAQLPESVHTVVIGAGFTGAAAAYYWSKRSGSDQQLVVLEMNEAASASSGRNQGTIVMGRYFTMVRDTVEPYLENVRSELSESQQRRLAEQFADVYSKAAYRNGDLIEKPFVTKALMSITRATAGSRNAEPISRRVLPNRSVKRREPATTIGSVSIPNVFVRNLECV